MTFTHALGTNNYGPAKFIVSATASNGTHTTIGAAITAASSGDTIFIRSGTYTEDLALKVGVNIAAFAGDQTEPTVTIVGKCTFASAGTVCLSNLNLQTNSDFLLAVTGSAASVVMLNNCNLNCSNNTGISYTTGNTSALVQLNGCTGNLGTTGIAYFASSSTGTLTLQYCQFGNTGNSSTANTASAGTLSINWCQITNPITTSGTSALTMFMSTMYTQPTNSTNLTTGGSTASSAVLCSFTSGSASAISVGVSQVFSISSCTIFSTNTNAITGAGAINYQGLTFTGSSKLINTTTQTGGLLFGGLSQAPSAGFIGESITSSVTAVGVGSNTPSTITSIVLTPGVWDVSAIAAFTASGGTGVAQAWQVGISTTTNAQSGGLGLEYEQFNLTTVIGSGSVPRVRAVVTTNTTYYLVCLALYSATSAGFSGRISATRVG